MSEPPAAYQAIGFVPQIVNDAAVHVGQDTGPRRITTGLLDANGVPIYRVVQSRKIGI